eukprot:2545555-Pyramimonas_sp.AAC.1
MLADCGNVSSDRFALAHRRSLTDINRKTHRDNEMHMWGAPRRAFVFATAQDTSTHNNMNNARINIRHNRAMTSSAM